MGGYIMQIQHFSVNDGEGIRSIVFMAGCPLRCAWCSNPEGQTQQNPYTHWVETKEVVNELRRESVFYRFSGGGVTFSGGEATAQPEFLTDLTNSLYDEGYDLAIESCAQFDFERLQGALKKMNLIFMDLKHPCSERHKFFTGVGNEQIISNIEKTCLLGLPVVVRIPAIVGVNADDVTMEQAFKLLKSRAPSAGVEILAYHRYGEDKYRRLNLPLPDESFAIPTREQMWHWESMAEAMGLQVVSYQ